MDHRTANHITFTNFTIDQNGLVYHINTDFKDDTIDIRIKRQFSPYNFDAIYTLDELQKMDKLFYMHDSLEDVYEFIKSKLNDKKVELTEGEDNISLKLILEVDQKEKHINLKIAKNPENNLALVVNDMSVIIQELMEKIKVLENPKFFEKSTIVKESEIKLIKDWFGRDIELTLLYKGAIHGDKASDFHARCDNRGPTISFIETTAGRRFGGYTTLNWDSSNAYKENDEHAFVFSLCHKRKFNITDQEHVIYCGDSYNVTFGGGHDFYINNDYGQAGSYSNFPHSYGVNEDYGDYKPNTMLAGTYHFYPKDVEVYSVRLI